MSRLKTVHIDFPPHARETHHVVDVCAFLHKRFDGAWPDGASVYHGAPSGETDVTPRDDAGVAHLQSLDGEFYVCALPSDPTGGFLTAIGLALFNYAVSAIFTPRPDVQSGRAQRVTSPNNALGGRANQVRLGERIEDIFGHVRAYPSLIAVPYTFFKNNVEYEFAAFCLGRGSYEFDETPREGETLVTDIDGVRVNAFLPGRNPNGTTSLVRTPSETWTTGAIDRKIDIVSRSASIIGQTLEAPNARTIVSTNSFDFLSTSKTNGPGVKTDDSAIDFAALYSIGDSVTISDVDSSVGGSVDVNGTYTVTSVATSYITLNATGWTWGASDFNDRAGTITSNESVSLGEFNVGDSSTDRLSINYTALNGLYKTDGQNQERLQVTIRVTVSKSGETDETFDQTIAGSGAVRETVGETQLIEPTFSGPYSIAIERLTDTDREEGFQVVDEVKVRDLFSLAPSTKTAPDAFGDVTILTAETEATSRALAQRDRKLNVLVTRKVKALGLSSNDYLPLSAGETLATARFRDILASVTTDEYIGGLDETDVDWVNIADTYTAVTDYFGIAAVAEFSHTFDDLSISFEDTVQQIARACFCTAYRDPDDGGKLKLRFERAQTDGSILFNHRNTIPGSVTRTLRFGNENDHDGVEVFYTDSTDDTQASVTLPTGTTPINPRRVRIPGLRGDHKVATLHAWRIWNKIRYGNTRDEREVTDEAALLSLGERVEMVDETRSDAQTGEIVSQDGLSLELSQPYAFVDGTDYVALIQLPSGVIESIAVTAGADDTHVTLGSTPSESLSLDRDNYARALYWLVPDVATARGRGFLMESVTPSGPKGQRRQVVAVNYDARYYENDDLYA